MIRSRFLSWLGRICSLWGLILMVMVCGCGKADRDFTFPVVITINNGDWGQVQSQPEGISCPDDCVEYYLEGTQLTLTAIPENWSKFEVWKGDCQGTDPIILVDVSDALTCAAEFAELAGTLHILSIEVRGSGTGTVMSLPTGIQCPDDCDQAFEENTQVTLIAVSQEGSQFEGWAGDCEGLQPQISIDMDASKSCTANFSFISEDSFALDLVLAGDGSGVVTSSPEGIQCPEDCSHAYKKDVSVVLNAVPHQNSEFRGWSGDCQGKNKSVNVTLDSDKQCTARFEIRATPTQFADQRIQWWAPASGTSGGFYASGREYGGKFWGLKDMNADELIDLVQTAEPFAGSDYTGLVWGYEDSPYWKVFLNNSNGFDAEPIRLNLPESATYGGFYYFSEKFVDSEKFIYRIWVTLDINNDGYPDLIHTADPSDGANVWGISDQPYWRVYINDSTTMATEALEWPVPQVDCSYGINSHDYNSSYKYWTLRDMDGDGLLDLVLTGDTSESTQVWGYTDQPYWKVFFNTGTGFELNAYSWTVPEKSLGGFYRVSINTSYKRWTVVDLDGDGLLDLVHTGDDSEDYRVWGYGDIPYWKFYRNTGEGFATTAMDWPVPESGESYGFYTHDRSYENRHWTLLDMDADGLLDLVQTADSGDTNEIWGVSDLPYWKVFYNTGSGFRTEAVDWLVPQSGTSGGFYCVETDIDYRRWFTLDIDNDGWVDLVQTNDTSDSARIWGESDKPYWRVFLAQP